MDIGTGKLAQALDVDPKTVSNAVKKSDAADDTCFFTFAILPTGDLLILDVDIGKLNGPEIINKIVEKHEPGKKIGHIGRFEFYDETKKAYAVVASSESALYANVMLRKGVVK